MAYVAPTYDQIRDQFLNDPANGPRVTPPTFVGTAGGGSGAGGAAPASSGLQAPGAGRFAALQGFLSANAPNAEAKAQSVAQPIEAEAQQAVSKADESSRLPGNYGGLDAATQAQHSRDDALSKVTASQSLEGVGTLFGGTAADYSPGARNADAILYGRTSALQNLGRWAPVLSALSPTYRPDYTWQAPADERLNGAPSGGGSTIENIGNAAKDLTKYYTKPPWDW